MEIGVAEFRAWLEGFGQRIADARDELTALDAAIGDADHGINMDRGMRAVLDRMPELSGPGATPGSMLKGVAMALISTVGGASGPLYGTFFLRMGAAAGDAARLGPEAFARALRAGLDGVVARGHAVPGDKTMVDAMEPAIRAAEDAVLAGPRADETDQTWPRLVESSRAAAAAGRDATTPLVARKGRASYLGERSAGHVDPGAASTAILFEALEEVVRR